jgi:hypothetical protein
MTTRTFQQHAKGFGAATANINVRLDGQEIFSGPVLTENAPLPVLPDSVFVINNVAFTWEKSPGFSGQVALEISVSGSPLLLADTMANYFINEPEFENQYKYFYQSQIGDILTTEPFSDVQIDGISTNRPENSDFTGQWWWKIMPGSTFACTVNIARSIWPDPPTE